MKYKYYKIANLIIALIVALFAVGQSFAWFINVATATPDFGGSSSQGYYARGDGSQTNPFVINAPVHLYNMAWLQNQGSYNDKVYYFEIDEALTGNLDMQAGFVKYVIPPIGNAQYPFKGDFNGNGKTVENLMVSTNKNVLTTTTSSDLSTYTFSNYVGLFGATAKGSEISNFILKNPIVEVADAAETAVAVDTSYATGEVAADSAPAVGIAVGQVNGKVESIGVNGGTLYVRRQGYTTFNSILGEVSADLSSSVTGGGKPDGTGANFGANFDTQSVIDRLYDIYRGKYGAEYKKGASLTPIDNGLPKVDTSSDYPVPASGEKMPFSIDTEKSKYSGSDAREVAAENNVGYFIGNQNKFQDKTLTFGEPLIRPESGSENWYTLGSDGTTHEVPSTTEIVPRWLYTYTNKAQLTGETYATDMGFNALTEQQVNDLPEGIKEIVFNDKTQETRKTIRLQNSIWLGKGQVGDKIKASDMAYAWNHYGEIDYMGKTYYEGTTNGSGVYLPRNVLWFKPTMVGKFRFVLYADKSEQSFELIKITRNGATAENPFNTETVTVSGVETIGTDIDMELVLAQRLSAYVLYYYEVEIKEEDIINNNVEYIMAGYGSGGAYFVYLDIGASAAADTGKVDGEKDISAVDFVYDGVQIKQTAEEGAAVAAGNFVHADGTSYTHTQASVYFEKTYTGILALYFVRSSEGERLLSVNAGSAKAYIMVTGNNAIKVTITETAVTPDFIS